MDHYFSEKQHLQSHQVDYDKALELGIIPKIGMTFESEDEAYEFYNLYALAAGFSIRKHNKYNRKRDNKLSWRELCCSCQGLREKHSKGTPNKSRSQTRFDCKAFMRIELVENSGNYVVTKLVSLHTHGLAAPDKAHMLRSHRRLRPAQKDMINSMTEAGIGPSKIYHYCAQEAGGYSKLNFLPADLDNMVQRNRMEFLRKGDGMLLLDYFRKKKKENSSFFYRLDLNDKNQIRNCCWCDAKSRIDYECFGDVVSFDTTYKTNDYEMPFAPFVGVNHHRQTITFASALISDETTETFIWVFETFLEAMGKKAMKTIFTDQAPAIGNAIKKVFPDAHHRLCIWHIAQNALRNLSHIFTKFPSFGDDFTTCIYKGEVEEDFLKNWENLLEKYDLREEKWLKTLFLKKEKWAQVYGRQHFCAGMASTQRSESMNNYFKKYFKRKQVLSEFMNQFDKAIELRRFKEQEADLKSNQSVPNLSSMWVVEPLARDFYTRKMFFLFQAELNKLVDLGAHNQESDDSSVVTYEVEFYNTGRVRRVEYIRSANTTKCSCQMFEFTGIPCAHMLKVWRMNNVKDVPSEYFLTRWSKAANPSIVINTSGNTMEVDSTIPLSERFSELSHIAQTLVTLGSLTDSLAEVAKRGMKRVIDEMEACKKVNQENVEDLADANTEDTRLVARESNVDQHQDNMMTIAAPPKKLKVGPGGRIKGFYDKMKTSRARQRKTSTGKKGKDAIEDVERNSQSTKPKPKKKGKKGKEDVARKKGKEHAASKVDVSEETTSIENPSIQNDGVEMTSNHQFKTAACTNEIQGSQFLSAPIVGCGVPQVSFSYQQLLADQCAGACKET